jgi:hypothetical protein
LALRRTSRRERPIWPNGTKWSERLNGHAGALPIRT